MKARTRMTRMNADQSKINLGLICGNPRDPCPCPDLQDRLSPRGQCHFRLARLWQALW
jgi:hypothetical protein